MEKKVKICPNGFHSNGNPDCNCGEKVNILSTLIGDEKGLTPDTK